MALDKRKALPALPLLKLELQRAGGDCAIATLASLTGSSYEDILVEAGKKSRARGYPHENGMCVSDIKRVAKQMGWKLREKQKCNFNTDEGILSVAWNKKKRQHTHHVVILLKGIIFDMADATVWLPEDYRRANKARFGGVLVPVT